MDGGGGEEGNIRYILISIWVLPNINAGQNMLLHVKKDFKKYEKWADAKTTRSLILWPKYLRLPR